MRPFAPAMYPDTIRVRVRTDDGAGAPAYEAPGEAMPASIQSAGPVRRETDPQTGAVRTVAPRTVRTATDPGVAANDPIVCGARALYALGPAYPIGRDDDGEPVSWQTDCEEVV